MTNPQKISGNSGGFFQGIADQAKLVWRLWLDNRISPLLKLLPLGSLIYLISPFDIPTPIDDVGVIWFFAYLFIELCPPEIVDEHRADIEKTIAGNWKKEGDSIEINEEDIIDADFEDLNSED
ncbi:MAG: hypothetical protein HON98_05175 [Chloroflexi bacterium]|jgi:hypothetical protein|nr:hypothetical protein [Chloroflexota bacterium]MBT3670215.1 hypothetical protein [Chloroflexota bacterium]MBT4003745.1 hypothetical protein [Chloroflexota bacterium]MBT4306111.1 hypothetical protein [Chloroflexota bacterium]MBT4534491.1 hypothetical protein [Chloroflexota bacterium]